MVLSKRVRMTEVPRWVTSANGKVWYGSMVYDSGAAAAASGSVAASANVMVFIGPSSQDSGLYQM